jgi:acyl CoA:acetate/3-ketoacid CoA transferase alpha subunit
VGVEYHFLPSLGFGLCGTPDTLIGALAKRNDIKNLTAVSNNAGAGEHGLGTFNPTRAIPFSVG